MGAPVLDLEIEGDPELAGPPPRRPLPVVQQRRADPAGGVGGRIGWGWFVAGCKTLVGQNDVRAKKKSGKLKSNGLLERNLMPRATSLVGFVAVGKPLRGGVFGIHQHSIRSL